MIIKNLKLIILFFTNIIFAQQDPSTQNASDISNMSAPNNANFLRYKESAINYYNGKASFSIPIYSINVGGIEYPISLNYTHGGIQVNAVASDVGLGWSLSNSFVNRTIVGDADSETIVDTRKKKYGFFDYNSSYPIGDSNDLNVDFYPDLFKFVTPTEISNFYFKDIYHPVELDQKNLKIDGRIGGTSYNYLKNENGEWVNDFTIVDFESFQISTKEGIQYNFQDNDVNHSFNYFDYFDGNNSNFGNIDATYPRISSWNISKIINLVNKEEINFEYDTYAGDNSNYIMDILNVNPYFRFDMFYPTATVSPADNNLFFRGDPQQSNRGKFYNRLLQVKRIKRINFRGGSVEFNYNINRQDLTNGKALTGIVIKDFNQKTIKEFEFEYDYFYSNLQNNEFSKRLKLISVKEKGQNKYQFKYYEDSKLPNIGSSLQDIFGFNNSVDTSFEPSNKQIPLYFYYPEKAEFSILPYDILNNSDHYRLDDYRSYFNGPQINKEPNELSKVWSLKSVQFPTGGINTYFLESNVFDLWGNDLKGGGVRVTKQTIEEKSGSTKRTINYNYNKENGKSSGYLFNFPQLGYPAGLLTPNVETSLYWLKDYFLLYSNAKINYDIVNNFFIGYSKVGETENGIKTLYEFSNEEEPNLQTRSHIPYKNITQFPLHPIGEFLVNNSSYGNDFFIDNSHKRGNLKYVSYFNKNGIVQSKKEYIYKGYEGVEEDNFPNRKSYFGTSIYSSPNSWHIYELIQFKKGYYTTYNNLIYSKSTSYLPSGNMEEEVKMDYDLANQNLRWVANKIANGVVYPEVNLKRFKYPYDFANDPTTMMDKLVEINKIGTPVLVQNEIGEINPIDFANLHLQNLVAQSKVLVSKEANTSNLILPVKTMAAIGTNDFHEIEKLQRYDDKGNLLQYSTKSGMPTTFIYGYHQTLPIAKIEGATYEQVMTALSLSPIANSSTYLTSEIVLKSDLDKDAVSENALIVALDSFRKNSNLAGFQITTYTYNPLIGITSITSPSGMREVYTYYDITNKLKEVKRQEKDAGGNFIYRTLQENEYHYKP